MEIRLGPLWLTLECFRESWRDVGCLGISLGGFGVGVRLTCGRLDNGVTARMRPTLWKGVHGTLTLDQHYDSSQKMPK